MGTPCIIAMVDLSNCGHETKMGTLYRRGPRAYFYGSDGNTIICEDSYGAKLTALDPAKVLKAMEADNKGNSYRRYEMAIPMLQAAIKGFPKKSLRVVLFGH